MIVVFVNSMEDTEMFMSVYKDIDCKLLYNPTRVEVVKTLKAYPNETLLCLGHGSKYGLFDKDIKDFVIDDQMEYLLRSREVIGVWCYAKQFALRNKLKGFFTDMFISNQDEAEYHCCKGNDDDVIMEQNRKFADSLNKLILNNTPINEWVDILYENADRHLNFVEYNYSKMAYLND